METYTNIFQEVGDVREYFEDSGFHHLRGNKQTNKHTKTEDTKDEMEDRETKKVEVAKEELGDEYRRKKKTKDKKNK